MIGDDEKKATEKYFGKSYDEIMETAKKNLINAGYDLNDFWVKKILEDDDGVSAAYINDIPKMDSTANLYMYLTTD